VRVIWQHRTFDRCVWRFGNPTRRSAVPVDEDELPICHRVDAVTTHARSAIAIWVTGGVESPSLRCGFAATVDATQWSMPDQQDEDDAMLHEIAESYREGGKMMWVITIFQAVSFALMAERIYVLFFKTRLNREAVLAGLRERIFRGDVMGAIRFLSDQPQSPLTRILKSGLLEVRHGEEEVQAAMDEAAMHEMPLLEKRTGYLSMISNASTLVGLLGTVGGMIGVFKAVASVSAADKSTMLAGGISEAMNCTWYGLMTAIPPLVVYSLLQGRTQSLQDDINGSVAATINMVMRNKDKLNVAAIES
jgi:biopolymer transport protein ExbB